MANDAGEISRRLTDNLEALVNELLPAGYRDGHEWRCGSVRGERGRSLGVRLTGPKRGTWCDFGEPGMGGDPLDLVKAAKGLSTAQAMDWARDWLGISRPVPVLPTAKPEARVAASAADKIARAKAILGESVPIWNTAAERYLLGRALDMRATGALFDHEAVRFHGSLFHWPSGMKLPAMVAAVVSLASNRLQGLHCTYLRSDGSGKADVEKPRLYYGPKAGGVVKLSPDAECTMGLAIGEGIESSMVGIMGFLPSWAALDAGNLAALPVLDGIDALSILEDADDAGRSAARKVADRWLKAGREVRILRTGRDGTDWNDIAQAEAVNA